MVAAVFWLFCWLWDWSAQCWWCWWWCWYDIAVWGPHTQSDTEREWSGLKYRAADLRQSRSVFPPRGIKQPDTPDQPPGSLTVITNKQTLDHSIHGKISDNLGIVASRMKWNIFCRGRTRKPLSNQRISDPVTESYGGGGCCWYCWYNTNITITWDKLMEMGAE